MQRNELSTRRLLLVGWCVLFCTFLSGQDIHFSQFYHSPQSLNPALTGVFGADYRFAAVFRNQWEQANAPFTTFQGAYDRKFFSENMKNGFFGGGLMINYDDAGDANLDHLQLHLSGSYTRMMDKENFLTIGVQVGFAQRSFDLPNLTFDNQWNGDVFDPTININESFERQQVSYPDFSAGINWHGQQNDSRARLDVGVAYYHLNRPNQSFIDGANARLPSRLSLYMMPTVQLNQRLDLVLNGMAQIQDTYVEILGGAAGRLHLSTQRGKELAVQFGVITRFNRVGDAVVPAAELHYRNWLVGFTYDINISDLRTSSRGNGGPELVLRHLITTVKPLKEFNLCPLL